MCLLRSSPVQFAVDHREERRARPDLRIARFTGKCWSRARRRAGARDLTVSWLRWHYFGEILEDNDLGRILARARAADARYCLVQGYGHVVAEHAGPQRRQGAQLLRRAGGMDQRASEFTLRAFPVAARWSIVDCLDARRASRASTQHRRSRSAPILKGI